MGSRAGLIALVVVLALVGGLAFWLMGDDPSSAIDTEAVVRPERPDTQSSGGLTIDAEGKGPEPLTPIVTNAEQLETVDSIVDPDLLDGATVFGRVTYQDDAPAADIDVQLFDHVGEFYDSIYTEDDGTYVLEAGEALAPGWSVMIESPDYEEGDKIFAFGPTAARHGSAHAPGDPPVRIDLQLLQAPRINGRVFDAVTLEAVELAEISIVSTHAAWLDEWQDQFTDEAGYYEMSITNLPPDGLLLWCYGDFQQPGAVGPLTLEPGQSYTYDFHLQPQRSLKGVVYDERTREPLEDADISVLPLHPEFEDPDGWDSSGDDGSFEIEPTETPFELLTLYVNHFDYAPQIIEKPGAEWPAKIEIFLRPTQTLKGKVLGGPDRVPVDGATISAVLTTAHGLLLEDEMDEELTDSDGSFVLPLTSVPTRQGRFMVSADGYYPYQVSLKDLVGGGFDQKLDVTIVLDPLVEDD